MNGCSSKFSKSSLENLKSGKRSSRHSKRKIMQNYKVIKGEYMRGKLNGEVIL